MLGEKYFSDQHEWVDVNGNIAKVGITNYAQVDFMLLYVMYIFCKLVLSFNAIQGKRFWNTSKKLFLKMVQ